MEKQLQKYTNIALRYLAIRERCSFEIEEKLLKVGATKEQSGKVIEYLQKENYLDNLRFAKAYCNDKFKYGGWGKQKIKVKLRALKISDNHISEALDYIDDEEYMQKAKFLGENKIRFIKAKSDYEKKQKLMLFLYSKGFSSEICRKVAAELLG
jgi:regulatory protein